MLTLHQCNNCSQYFDEDELRPIRDLTQRVSEGEIMPSGECPNLDCRALCQPEPIRLKNALTILFERLDGDHEDPTSLFTTPSTPETRHDARLICQALGWVEATKNELS
jgi:hypothetical protein